MNTLSTLKAKRATVAAELRALAMKDDLTVGEDERLTRLTRQVQKIEGEIAAEELAVDEQRRKNAETLAQPGLHRHAGIDPSPTYWKQTTRSEIFDSNPMDRRVAVDHSLRAADLVAETGDRDLVPELRRHLERHVDFADQFRATANPDYLSAFGKILGTGDPGRAFLQMSDAERHAVQQVASVEARAMNEGTGSAGAYAVPQLLDPSIWLSNSGSSNPFRRISRIVTGVSDKWAGITSAGITASWDGEGTEVSDDSPSDLKQPEITAYKGAAFVATSLELLQDWQGMALEMQRLMADAKDRLEGTAFATGSGSGQPYGVLTRLDANTNSEVVVTTDGAFGAVDVLKAFAELPARYRSNASWVMSLSMLNQIRNFSNSQNLGTQVVNLQSDYAFQLLGRPVYESSDFPSFTGTTSAANLLVVGDFSTGSVIFDRLGSARVDVIPHLLGTTNNRPTGQSGFYFYWRTGHDLISPTGETGFRLLQNQ